VSRCIFELVYFSRPDSRIFGVSVDHVRRELGRQLARFHPANGADIVFSVPDSSNVMALGYSEVSGVKLEHGLIRNHYVGRTFINPVQALRVQKVKIKFNPVRDVIRGKSVCVVDDSLVRGTTSKGLVEMIRDAGAREVHLRLASPPITGPCHYGIDTPTRDELIAATHSREEIRDYLAVDSLEYLTLDEMIDAAGRQTRWCHACFSGDYPTPVQLTLGATTLAARAAADLVLPGVG
jgi:amidophosphoribosyltransferase